MLDIKQIRADPAYIDKAMGRRGLGPVSAQILEIDQHVRSFTAKVQELQEQRRAYAKQFQQQNSGGAVADVAELKQQLAEAETALDNLQGQLRDILLALPNLPADDCVDGKDENDNRELRLVGAAPVLDFTPKEHQVLAEDLGILDVAGGVKLAGARFAVLAGPLARLERAVAQFMLDTHTSQFGYQEMYVPVLVSSDIMMGTGQLPKFAEDAFVTIEGLWLIPTAEVALTNLARDRILSEQDLPIRLTAYTPCFRSEAGSAGRDTRGIFRQRQFGKVELVSITTPEQELAEHARMTEAAENILKLLELPYRVVELCTGDMGFSARKTYDIEVWLPGQNTFREISSCSRCGDFQARRMNARYRPAAPQSKPAFVSTLNGSGLAVGRTLVAILENYQQKDGSVRIPEALRRYMGGAERLDAIANPIRG